VAVKIKLKRMGKIHAPYYRVVVADARAKRDGRAIEEIGKYHPKLEPSLIDIDSERAQYWLSVGAQPTDPVRNLLKITGDWQRFHGQDGTEGTLKTASPTAGKKETFAAALKETYGESEGAATTPKGRRRPETKAAKPEARPATAAKAAGAAPGADDAAAKPETGKAVAAEPASAEAASAEARADARPAEDKAPAADQAAEDGNAATSAASTHAPEVDGDATAGAAAAADEVGSGA
jgi:small subunit ribosomal protein S16